VFDIVQGKLREFNIKYCTDIVLDIAYKDSKQCYIDNTAQCKLWDKKIAEIIPNKEMRDAFKMFCGTFLIKRNELKVEYICYLIGSGSNGKSVVASAIAGVFGERYFGRFTPYDLFRSTDAKVNMAALDGKIGNLTDDLEDKDISGGAFKRFISGEKFQARRLYSEPILVQAPVMLCCTNTMPDTADDSYGHHRRQLPIYTTLKQFRDYDTDASCVKDPYLTQKLTTPEARQYIFNWIYEGYKMIMRNGGNIVLGKSVLDAQEALKADSSPARRWCRDMGYVAVHTDALDPRWRSLSSLYAEFKDYAKRNGSVLTSTDSRLVSNMFKSQGFEWRKRSDGLYFLVGRLGEDTKATGELIMRSQKA
jgi:phage/plasmid-associated DNA primase